MLLGKLLESARSLHKCLGTHTGTSGCSDINYWDTVSLSGEVKFFNSFLSLQ